MWKSIYSGILFIVFCKSTSSVTANYDLSSAQTVPSTVAKLPFYGTGSNGSTHIRVDVKDQNPDADINLQTRDIEKLTSGTWSFKSTAQSTSDQSLKSEPLIRWSLNKFGYIIINKTSNLNIETNNTGKQQFLNLQLPNQKFSPVQSTTKTDQSHFLHELNPKSKVDQLYAQEYPYTLPTNEAGPNNDKNTTFVPESLSKDKVSLGQFSNSSPSQVLDHKSQYENTLKNSTYQQWNANNNSEQVTVPHLPNEHPETSNSNNTSNKLNSQVTNTQSPNSIYPVQAINTQSPGTPIPNNQKQISSVQLSNTSPGTSNRNNLLNNFNLESLNPSKYYSELTANNKPSNPESSKVNNLPNNKALNANNFLAQTTNAASLNTAFETSIGPLDPRLNLTTQQQNTNSQQPQTSISVPNNTQRTQVTNVQTPTNFPETLDPNNSSNNFNEQTSNQRHFTKAQLPVFPSGTVNPNLPTLNPEPWDINSQQQSTNAEHPQTFTGTSHFLTHGPNKFDLQPWNQNIQQQQVANAQPSNIYPETLNNMNNSLNIFNPRIWNPTRYSGPPNTSKFNPQSLSPNSYQGQVASVQPLNIPPVTLKLNNLPNSNDNSNSYTEQATNSKTSNPYLGTSNLTNIPNINPQTSNSKNFSEQTVNVLPPNSSTSNQISKLDLEVGGLTTNTQSLQTFDVPNNFNSQHWDSNTQGDQVTKIETPTTYPEMMNQNNLPNNSNSERPHSNDMPNLNSKPWNLTNQQKQTTSFKPPQISSEVLSLNQVPNNQSEKAMNTEPLKSDTWNNSASISVPSAPKKFNTNKTLNNLSARPNHSPSNARPGDLNINYKPQIYIIPGRDNTNNPESAVTHKMTDEHNAGNYLYESTETSHTRTILYNFWKMWLDNKLLSSIQTNTKFYRNSEKGGTKSSEEDKEFKINIPPIEVDLPQESLIGPFLRKTDNKLN